MVDLAEKNLYCFTFVSHASFLFVVSDADALRTTREIFAIQESRRGVWRALTVCRTRRSTQSPKLRALGDLRVGREG